MSKKLNVIWSEWKYYVPPSLNASLSLTLYWVGYMLSDCSSSMPLARAGAMATTISIAFTLWNFKEILDRGQQRGTSAYSRAIDNMNLSHQNPDELKDNFSRKLAAATNRIDARITIAQALILMLATLVWGFGDLAHTYL